RVLAPFDGRVTAKNADAGDLASPGMPLLALEREGGYRVDLVVPENYIQSVHLNEPVDVRISAIGEKAIKGTVKVIVPSADPNSRTFTVQVDIPTVPGLRSGMFARAPLTVGEQKTLRIPRPAVVQQGQLTGVYIVDADNTARFRLIRIGRTDDDQVEVISGIGDNTRLVVEPPAQLKNGSHVEFAK
uniref:efflux RND transporter periplasmic adaptor subunit n=1 Tax=Desulfosarcina cetonica TaxID=90730 RepID=UPI0012ECC70E